MSQTWTANCYQEDHVADTDLTNMEVNFATLRSTFSGTGAPANAEAGLLYFNTTNNLLMVRNAANSAYYGVMHGDTSQKIWVYRNAVMPGWGLDNSVTDRVLALKGGSGYYATGGTVNGLWHHIHNTPTHAHYYSSNAHTHTGVDAPQYQGTFGDPAMDKDGNSGRFASTEVVTGTTNASGTLTTNTTNTDWRPAAAIGVLMYPLA